MNWFERHLNWAAGFSIFLAVFFYSLANIKGALETVVGLSFSGLTYSLLSQLSKGSLEYLEFIFSIIALAVVLPVLLWVLKQKHRDLWWSLIVFVPFGWIVFLALKNKSQVIDIKDGEFATRPREKND